MFNSKMFRKDTIAWNLWILVSVHFSITTVYATIPDESCGNRVISSPATGRIVNGSTAYSGKWPWQASLLRFSDLTKNYYHVCGGSLINNQWVITAAHCFKGNSVTYSQVVLGSHSKYGTEDSAVTMAVSSIICHESYEQLKPADDICLIKLAGKIAYNDHIQPICLPNINSSTNECYVTGWGDTKETGDQNILQEALVHILNKTDCIDWYAEDNTQIPENHICAGHEEGLIDSCQGDSGGPLACRNSDRFILIGITSFGEGCAMPQRPGVYVNVVKYLDWIKKIVEHNIGDDLCFSTPPSCGIVITTDTKIRSPVSDKLSWMYPPNSQCTWTIQAPKNHSIYMEFLCFFQIGNKNSDDSCDGDFLRLRVESEGLEGRLCGSSLSDLPAQNFELSPKEVELAFISDGKNQSLGFVIFVYFLNDSVKTDEPSTTTAYLDTSTLGYQSSTQEVRSLPEITDTSSLTAQETTSSVSSSTTIFACHINSTSVVIALEAIFLIFFSITA